MLAHILSTRRIEVRTLCSWRSRTQTVRWPSPTKRLEASTARISVRSSSSEMQVFGPRLAGSTAITALSVAALNRCTVARDSRHVEQPRWIP